MPLPSWFSRAESPAEARRSGWIGSALGAVLLSLHAIACASPAGEPIEPIPAAKTQNPVRVEIGRRLFQDARLSANGTVSCASCHRLSQGGGDGRAKAIGFDGRQTAVNTPTVLNAALNSRQFWDGRAATLEAQIDAVVQSRIEMGSAWDDVVRKVDADPAYRSAFAVAYPGGVSKQSIQDAIASYERTLITPDSRFDRFLRGDAGAITATEKAGYAAFKRNGCAACHQGVNVGGNMYQKFGYFSSRASTGPASEGRFAVTGKGEDRQVFKVPSLRNVALTAPYFHDASAQTLEDAVDVMFAYQLGRVASPGDKASIVQFLKTLTGELPKAP